MKNVRYFKSYLFCFFALTVIFCSTAAFGATIHVPGDYPTIQEAINAASYSGDTVLVANGTYTGTGNKDLDFYGKAITVQSENGPENCIIDCEGSGRGFYFHSNEGEDSVVSGFTITNGNNYYGDGGGIYCYYSSPTITNCTITENSADEYYDSYNGAVGGGIYCYYSDATITNCTITKNSAVDDGGDGGGIYCYYSSPTITNCTITGNSAGPYGGDGGGIYCGDSSPTITNCTIGGNSADGGYGGGIYCDDSSPTITNCTITGNSAYKGSGISCHYHSEAAITNSTITENSGGGIYCYYSDATIINCTITENCDSGGIYCDDSSPTITNCTITKNSASEYGGGIFSDNSSPTITNCICWKDTPVEIQASGGGVPIVTYSDIQGGYPGHGNINADPLFVSDSDYHLTASSPCINSGDNDAPDLPATDKDGNPRIFGGTVDMGAYEFQTIAYIVYIAPDGLCDGHTPCYSKIQDGIGWEGFVFTIKAEQGTYGEDIIFDEPKEIIFKGGWDSTFTSPSGETKTNSMTISDGTVVLDEGCLAIGE
jgi:parallel beta-helix repeat protein